MPLSSMRRQTGVLACAALGTMLGACERTPEEGTPIVRPVRYERVVPRGSEQVRAFSGVAQAALDSTLSFKVQGTITQLPFDVGDVVQPGQVIARLDPTDYRVRQQEAEAGLAQAQAGLRNAEASYQRVRGLYENRNASRSDLDAARAAAESAQAQVRAARQQLEAARLQLSYTELRAPQTCTVAAKLARESENVAAGQGVVRLTCGDCAEVEVAVPGGVIAQISQGSQVDVAFGAVPDRSLRAVVTEVGVASGQLATTFPVTVALQEGCERIRAGMPADVRFRLPVDVAGHQLVVPPVAVGEDGDGNYVFVLEAAEDGRWFTRRRAVEVDGMGPEGVLVSRGLDAGELIVTAGVSRISDGLEVRLLGE